MNILEPGDKPKGLNYSVVSSKTLVPDLVPIQDFQDFKILIRIRTPNRGIDPTVTHIHETITIQKKTLKKASKKTRIGRQSKTNGM